MFFILCLSCFCVCSCCLVVTCCERADLLALVGDVYCIFVAFPCSFLGKVWYLIVSFPDFCLLSYFNLNSHAKQYPLICITLAKYIKKKFAKLLKIHE